MAQARRIKPKKQKAKPIAKRRRDIPWGLLLVVVFCLSILGSLWHGVKTQNPHFGAGINYWLSIEPVEPKVDQKISQHIETRSAETEFGFYELLKNMDQVMPDDLPDSLPSRGDENVEYYVQAASFRSHSDADKLRVQLAEKGYKSVTQATEVKDRGVFYRVRLGPYADQRRAKNVKNKLETIGVRAYYYKVDK